MLTRLNNEDDDPVMGSIPATIGWYGPRAEALAELIRKLLRSEIYIEIGHDDLIYGVMPSIVRRCNTIGWGYRGGEMMSLYIDEVRVMRDDPDDRSKATSLMVAGTCETARVSQFIPLDRSTTVNMFYSRLNVAVYRWSTMPININEDGIHTPQGVVNCHSAW